MHPSWKMDLFTPSNVCFLTSPVLPSSLIPLFRIFFLFFVNGQHVECLYILMFYFPMLLYFFFLPSGPSIPFDEKQLLLFLIFSLFAHGCRTSRTGLLPHLCHSCRFFGNFAVLTLGKMLRWEIAQVTAIFPSNLLFHMSQTNHHMGKSPRELPNLILFCFVF